jgi:hypothetical protein
MVVSNCANKFIKLCRVHPLASLAILLLLFVSVKPSVHATFLRSHDCGFHSQYSQDEFLERNYFKGKQHGVYVDLGAYNPTELSNTAYFDKCRGWQGICVDANPTRAALKASDPVNLFMPALPIQMSSTQL